MAVAGITLTFIAAGHPDVAAETPHSGPHARHLDQPLDQQCAGDPPDGVQTGLTFNDPDTDERDAIRNHIVGLVCAAEPGSEIRVSAHYFADQPIREALVEKHQDDGVEIQVIVDAGVVKDDGDDYSEYDDLADVIGSDRSQSSWIDHCREATRACIGGGEDDYETALMHNKFFLFSETAGTEDVVLQTSHNFKEGGSGTGMWNTAFTVADEPVVYDHYRAYFDDLAAEDPKQDDYYENNSLPQPEQKYRIFHSPAKSANPIMDQLDKIDCTKTNDAGGTEDGRTIVRVAVWLISGTESTSTGSVMAAKLKEMDDQGCEVDVVVDQVDTGEGSETGPLQALLAKPEGGNHGPEVREFYAKSEQGGLHSKDILVDGHFDGQPDQKVVLTGTHNLTWKSARVNDETTLVINDADTHDDYLDFFTRVRSAASLTWQTGTYDR